MFINPLHLCIAFVPLALYLWGLGITNLRRRPVVTSGMRDTFLLGLALLGLAIVGPLELLLPESTVFRLGGYAWIMLVTFYLLVLTLIILLMRPRLVIYNVTVEQLRPVLARIVQKLDEQARWAGDSLVLPKLGVQLYMERFHALRNVQLIATAGHQHFDVWKMLEKRLRAELAEANAKPKLFGAFLVMIATLMLSLVIALLLGDRAEIAHSFQEMIRR